jgi:hypothetical protein
MAAFDDLSSKSRISAFGDDQLYGFAPILDVQGRGRGR